MSKPDRGDGKWWRASLSIFSTSLTNQEISDRLGLIPTRTHEMGQPRGLRRGDGTIDASNVWPNSAWHLTRPLGRDHDLREHIGWILDTIEPKRAEMEFLRSKCTIRLFCGFASHHEQGGFTLDPETLYRIAGLGLNLELDLYSPSEWFADAKDTANNLIQ